MPPRQLTGFFKQLLDTALRTESILVMKLCIRPTSWILRLPKCCAVWPVKE